MKKSGCLTIFLFVFLCLSLFFNMLLLIGLFSKGSSQVVAAGPERTRGFEEVLLESGNSSDRIAVIPLQGIISYSQAGVLGPNMIEDLKIALRQAARDPKVKAVVLEVNSPGGEITASDVLYHEVQLLAEKKPVVTYFQSLGASGAYYMACGSSWIMANESTFTGSIGVIISTLNYEDLFNKVGLDSIVFKSGAFKDMLSGTRPITPEEQQYVQGLVMQSYERFLNIVAQAREQNPDALRDGVADGRILSGLDAKDAGLVDELGYIEDAFSKARELSGAEEAQVVRYQPGFALGMLFRMFGEAPKVEIKGIEKLTPQLEPGRIYLLPPFYAP